MRYEKIAVLALLACLFSLGAQAAVIPPSAGPHSVYFASEQVTVRDEGTGYSAEIEIKSRLSIGVLIGGPVFTCVASWKLLSVNTGDDAYDAGVLDRSGPLRLSNIPSSILRSISLYDVEIAYPIEPNWAAVHSAYNHKLFCDAGIMSTAGSDNPSFNFPATRSWHELIWNGNLLKNEKPDEAKSLFVEMLSNYEEFEGKQTGFFSKHFTDVSLSKVRSASINLWAVRNWLDDLAWKQAQKVRQQAEAREKRVTNADFVTEGGRANDDAFDAFMSTVYQKAEARQTVAKIQKRRTIKPDRTGLDRKQMMAALPNGSCAERGALSRLNGSWDAGEKMLESLGSCAGDSFDPEFVATGECGGGYYKVPTLGLVARGYKGSSSSYREECGWYKHYFADENGRKLTPAIYSYATDFSPSGYAAVRMDDLDVGSGGAMMTKGSYSIVNSHFDVVGKLDAGRFSFGRRFQAQRLVFTDPSLGKKGAVDGRFKVAIPAQFEELEDFDKHAGAAMACDRVEREYKVCGYVNQSGERLFRFRKWRSMEEDVRSGLIAACKPEPSGCGYLDLSGKEVVSFRYRRTETFREGYGLVMDDSGRWMFIDAQGRVVLETDSYKGTYTYDVWDKYRDQLSLKN